MTLKKRKLNFFATKLVREKIPKIKRIRKRAKISPEKSESHLGSSTYILTYLQKVKSTFILAAHMYTNKYDNSHVMQKKIT